MKKVTFTFELMVEDDVTPDEAKRRVMNRVGILGTTENPVHLVVTSVSDPQKSRRGRSSLDLDRVLEGSIDKAPRDF